jgi:outer membrane protein assembly factor BamA
MKKTRCLTILFIAVLLPKPLCGQSAATIPGDQLIIRDIVIEGNKVTRENIILRELVFSKGDTIPKMELLFALERCRENLLNLSIFNFVTLDVAHHPENRIDVFVEVQERWYIWPNPIFEHGERNLSTFLKEPRWDRLNYGFWLRWNNFRGRNELLNAKVRLGYKEQYVLQYEKPNLGRNEAHKIDLSYSLSRQHRINYTTMNNRPVFFVSDNNGYSWNSADAFAAYSYRPGIYSRHRFRVHFVDEWISDTIAVLNPQFFGEGFQRFRFFSVDYVFRYDIRDSKIYPLEGEAVKIKLERTGLGIIKDFPHQNFEAEGTLFFHRKINNRIYFANVATGKLASNDRLPQVMQDAFGYSVNMTGYDDFVIDGMDYFINKVVLKYQLVPPREVSLPYKKLQQFTKVHYAMYLNLLGDVGYVNNKSIYDPSNFMINEWQYSVGIGLDFVTYYDKVLGFEFAVNRYGMSGFFFHAKTPFLNW